MPQEHPPNDFDWVAAQAKCTPQAMFERLQSGVKKDVERRNFLAGREEPWKFEFHEEEDRFEVSRVVSADFTGSKTDAFVRFERQGRRIQILGEGVDVDFTAIVALDVAGSCRFIVGEAEYSDWEIRRMALEQLFFAETE
jgi:hypothetical protein